ncbi:MAG: hypothetical protein HON04_18930 [Planctomicrobium sp.]|jgi:hypothetical protein|nr:hypothetical protein [Planctomicrobium sp.]
MKSQTTAVLAVALFSVYSQFQPTCHAYCPTWDPGPQTLREYHEESDVVVFGELIKVVPANEEQKFAGTSAVKIRHIVKDTSKKYEIGEILTLQRDLKLAKGEQLLLAGELKQEKLRWWLVEKSSSAVQDYLLNAPEYAATPKEQLIYFLQFLEHQNHLLAHDSYLEINTQENWQLIADNEATDFLDRTELRQWLEKYRFQHMERVGMYAIMLGHCGNKTDVVFMEETIREMRDDFPFGIDGMVTGYLLLTGDKGFQFLDKSILNSPDVAFSQKFAALQAMRFMRQYEVEQISIDRLCQSMRILLEDPKLVDLIILDLAKWSDWSIGDRLMTMYNDEKFNAPIIKRAIARYFLMADRSWDETSKEVVPAYVIQARQNIKTLEEADPKTMKIARRYIFE